MNLLSDPLIRSEPAGAMTLPGVLDAFGKGRIAAFPALRPHQRTAWHMFLVQLGVLAIGRSGWPEDEAGWRNALLALTDGDDRPWLLVAEDPKHPAFLQPPDPGGLKWSEVSTPDALDLLITSKNHDLKTRIAASAAEDDWIFALISLQTMEGYGGAGNQGVARMNGGSSSRPLLGLAPVTGQGAVSLSGWWRRDVERLLSIRTEIWDGPGRIGGKALLWCEPWPERQTFTLTELDPLFIECCRRIRLAPGLVARRATSAAPRIDAKVFKGAVGDPWTPVHRSEAKAFTIGEGSFDYRMLRRLLFSGEWAPPALALPGPDEDAAQMVLVAEALSRGNSKTDGLKRRVIPLPQKSDIPFLGQDAAAVSDILTGEISRADRALCESVALFVARGDRDKVGKEQREQARGARSRFDNQVDREFFPALWRRLAVRGAEGEIAEQMEFRARLVTLAENELKIAFASIPTSTTWAPRARVRAERRFFGMLRTADMIMGAKNVG